jgi:hypothetical protein
MGPEVQSEILAESPILGCKRFWTPHSLADHHGLCRTVVFDPSENQCVGVWRDVLERVAKLHPFAVHGLFVIVHEVVAIPIAPCRVLRSHCQCLLKQVK